MKKVAFVKSTKKFEHRVAILPHQLESVENCKNLFFQKDYALHLGIADVEYQKYGANVSDDLDFLYSCDILIDPKIGDAIYLDKVKPGITTFGYFHAVQNENLTNLLIERKFTCYAWEDMYEDSVHTFNKNNILAGFASVMHASTIWGTLIKNKKVAVIGRGNTAQGAIEALSKLGAEITIITRKDEKFLKSKLSSFDVVVNAVLWDVQRKDYLISKEDLSRMKNNSLIIDISCDIDGAIESSYPTSLDNPIYKVDHVYHYTLGNSPTLYAFDASEFFGEKLVEYLDEMVEGVKNTVLGNSLIIENGIVIDQRINVHQNRKAS